MKSKREKIIIAVISLLLTIGVMIYIFVAELKRSVTKYVMGKPK